MQTADLDRPAGASAAERELVITRILDAPRELVFKAWTEPDRAIRWWGPRGFTTAHYELDFRPDGAYRVCMRSPEGTEHSLHQAVFETVTARDLHQGGWASALECLAEYLAA